MAVLKIVSLGAKRNADLEHHRTEVIRLLEEALQAAKEGNYRAWPYYLLTTAARFLTPGTVVDCRMSCWGPWNR